MLKRTTIIETITVLNIILFLYTGIAKAIDYSVFKEQLASNALLAPFAISIAILIPTIEFVTIIILAIPRWRLKGLYVCLALMIVFTAYIICILVFANEIPCSCGGVIELMTWQQHLIFNGSFILLDTWAIMLLRKVNRDSLERWLQINTYKAS